MVRRGNCRWLALALTAAGLAAVAGCHGAIGGTGIGPDGQHGTGGRPFTGAGGNGGAGPGAGGGGGGGAGATSAYLPTRVRRLSNAEYDASVQVLLGTKLAPSATFP